MSIESSVIFFPCADIRRTEDFYTKICGLRVHQKQGGGSVVIFDTGYGYIGFCQYDDGRPIPGGELSPCISFNCEDEADVDATFERVKALGAEVIAPPARHPKFPVYSCFFRDPDGYKVEFQKISG